GFSHTISMGQYITQPDVVIANVIEDFDGAVPDFIIGVVYVEEVPGTGGGHVFMRTYGVYNVGTPGIYLSLLQQSGQINGLDVVTKHGNIDGNPHIDMWTSTIPSDYVEGNPGLRDFAISWSEDLTYTACSGPFPNNYYLNPPTVYYAHADINNIAPVVLNKVKVGPSNGMSDVACFTDMATGQQMLAVAYGGAVSCSLTGLAVNEYERGDLLPTATYHLSSDNPVIVRIEAMSHYYPDI